jgi:hypothetical protein
MSAVKAATASELAAALGVRLALSPDRAREGRRRGDEHRRKTQSDSTRSRRLFLWKGSLVQLFLLHKRAKKDAYARSRSCLLTEPRTPAMVVRASCSSIRRSTSP